MESILALTHLNNVPNPNPTELPSMTMHLQPESLSLIDLREAISSKDLYRQSTLADSMLFSKKTLRYESALYLRNLSEFMQRDILLSIIIVTKNASAELEETVKSVQKHTSDKRVEFIIYDGMSTDNTFNATNDIEGIICIRDQDSGIYDAMNKASSIARGRFLFYLNSGDLIKPSSFTHLLSQLGSEEFSNKDIIYFSTEYNHTDGRKTFFSPVSTETIWVGNCFSHQGCFISRKAFVEHGGYDILAGITADYVLMNRIIQKGNHAELKDFCFCSTAPFGVSADYKQRAVNRLNYIPKLYKDSPYLDDYIAFYCLFLKLPFETGPRRLLKILENVKENLSLNTIDACDFIFSYSRQHGQIHKLLHKDVRLLCIENSRVLTASKPKRRRFDEGNLIFLVSMPRSGSTLLQRIMMTSYKIHTTSEPWLMLNLLGTASSQKDTSFGTYFMQKANSLFLEESNISSSEIQNSIKNIAIDLYRKSVENINEGAEFFLDKTPRYLHIIKSLYSVFPNAKYIVLNRSPLDIACSYISTWCDGSFSVFRGNELFMNDFEIGIDGLVWINQKAESSSNILTMQYGDLVSEPERTMEKVAHFLELNAYSFNVDYSSTFGQTFGLGDPKGIHKFSRPERNESSWKEGVSDYSSLIEIKNFIDSISEERYNVISNRKVDGVRLEALEAEYKQR